MTERALRRWLIGGILAASTMVVLPVIAILAALVAIPFGGNWWVFSGVFWALAGAAMLGDRPAPGGVRPGVAAGRRMCARGRPGSVIM